MKKKTRTGWGQGNLMCAKEAHGAISSKAKLPTGDSHSQLLPRWRQPGCASSIRAISRASTLTKRVKRRVYAYRVVGLPVITWWTRALSRPNPRSKRSPDTDGKAAQVRRQREGRDSPMALPLLIPMVRPSRRSGVDTPSHPIPLLEPLHEPPCRRRGHRQNIDLHRRPRRIPCTTVFRHRYHPSIRQMLPTPMHRTFHIRPRPHRCLRIRVRGTRHTPAVGTCRRNNSVSPSPPGPARRMVRLGRLPDFPPTVPALEVVQ